MLAGIQITLGFFSVAPAAPHVASTGPLASSGRSERLAKPPVVGAADITFAVRPQRIANELWLVFRGTRDRRTGRISGEIVPDLQMRVLSLVPGAFLVGGFVAVVTTVVVPVLRGDPPSLFLLAWSAFAVLAFSGWTWGCGAAVHDAASNVQRDSPGSHLAWHLGLRCGSRAVAPAPPPGSPTSADAARSAGSTRSTWLGLSGLLVPAVIVMVLIVPWVRAGDERADWVRVPGLAGEEVDPDHRRVTYVLPDGRERTSTVPVMRGVVDGEIIELYYPPGQPELIEQDRSGFVLPYFVFGGFAAVVTAAVIGRFVIDLRRSRRGAPDG
jgi:hypothetical protein